jgi:hypothetical protein
MDTEMGGKKPMVRSARGCFLQRAAPQRPSRVGSGPSTITAWTPAGSSSGNSRLAKRHPIAAAAHPGAAPRHAKLLPPRARLALTVRRGR